MIEPIVTQMRDCIKTLDFVGRAFGLASTKIVTIRTKDGTTQKRIPVIVNDGSYELSGCVDSDILIPIFPDDSIKSLHFFTGGSSVVNDEDSFYYYCSSDVRLNSWYNLSAINYQLRNANQLEALLMAAIPFRLDNIVNQYVQITCSPVSVPASGADIFSAWNFNDEENQFGTFPYECCAIDYTLKYAIPIKCIEPVIPKPNLC